MRNLLLSLIVALPAWASLPDGALAFFTSRSGDGPSTLFVYRWEQPAQGKGHFALVLKGQHSSNLYALQSLREGGQTVVLARSSTPADVLLFRVPPDANTLVTPISIGSEYDTDSPLFSVGERLWWDFTRKETRLLGVDGKIRTLFSTRPFAGDSYVRIHRLNVDHLGAVFHGAKSSHAVLLKLSATGDPEVEDRWTFDFGDYSFGELVFPTFNQFWMTGQLNSSYHGGSYSDVFYERIKSEYYLREVRRGHATESTEYIENSFSDVLRVDGSDPKNPSMIVREGYQVRQYSQAGRFSEAFDLRPLIPTEMADTHLTALEYPPTADFWEIPYDDATLGAEAFHWKRKFLAELQSFEAHARRPIPTHLPKEISLSLIAQMDAAHSEALVPLHQVPKEQLAQIGLEKHYTLVPARTAAWDATAAINELARLATSCATLLAEPYQPLF